MAVQTAGVAVPHSIETIDDASEAIQVSLSRDQVKNAPDIDTKKPVSRQSESEFSRYYGYSPYWTGPYMWGMGRYPIGLSGVAGILPTADGQRVRELNRAPLGAPSDVHLRSSDEVCGYAIHGADEDIGHVKDFIFDDQEWPIRYLVVDTRNWWPGGKKILIGTQWIESINWADAAVQVKLTRDQIKDSPAYDEDAALNRDYEARLHDFYDRKGYWD